MEEEVQSGIDSEINPLDKTIEAELELDEQDIDNDEEAIKEIHIVSEILSNHSEGTVITNFREQDFLEFSESSSDFIHNTENSPHEIDEVSETYEHFDSGLMHSLTPQNNNFVTKIKQERKPHTTINTKMTVAERNSYYKSVGNGFNQSLLKILPREDKFKRNFKRRITVLSQRPQTGKNFIDLLERDANS